MSKSVAYKHYIRALSRWPKDALRPECQFQDVLRRRVEKRFIPSAAPTSASVNPKDKSSAATTMTQAIVAKTPINEKFELEQANAIYSLLGNRYSKKYPITGSLMKPASNPTHYTDLLKELQEAPGRGFFARLANRWKGALRFS